MLIIVFIYFQDLHAAFVPESNIQGSLQQDYIQLRDKDYSNIFQETAA